jgi:hypothetical protein
MNINLTTYLPLMSAILSLTLGYFFGIRTKKNDRLFQYTQENIKEVLSPMYHEMLVIIEEGLVPKDRENLIFAFFKTHQSSNTLIYKFGNMDLFEAFYDLSIRYREFKQTRNESLWKEFWHEFENTFFYKLKKEYIKSTSLIFHEFKWQQYIQTKPYWLKSYYEVMKFLFETMQGIIVISLLFVYFSGLFKLFGLGLFPKDFFTFSCIILGLSVIVTLILIMPNFTYIDLKSNSKQSFFRNTLKKLLPKLSDKWDKFLVGKKNFDKVPKMYEKKNIDF